MAILQLIQEPDPLLRQRSKEVELVDDEIRRIMNDMLETMYHSRGIGLAAVQVGIHKRIIVLDIQNREECLEGKEVTSKSPLYMANVDILEKSKDTSVMEEGCLSVLGQLVKVERPHSIKVRYLDYNNEEQILEASGFLSKVIQHENDHLDGKLIIDYLSPLKKALIIKKLQKIKKTNNLYL